MTETQAFIFRSAMGLGALLFFLVIELIRPYRRPTVSKGRRWFHNLGITAVNNVILSLVFGAATVGAIMYVTQNKIGVLNLIAMGHWIKILATLVFMDFMLYVWHLLNHEMPFLWRFHRVHHTDLNMDVSTATRFHPGELAISAVIKLGLIYLIGADLWGVVIFEAALLLSAQFHHSSLEISPIFQKILWLMFVPPSMHRIHHSVVIKERNTNYGTIFSLWDRFMGTMKRDVDQDKIKIGVGAYPRFEKLGLWRLLVMPVDKPVK